MNPFMKSKRTVRIAAWLILLSAQPLHANTLTIGKGSGVVWQGGNFNANVVTLHNNSTNSPATGGAASITTYASECIPESAITTINGFQVYLIAPGIGLAPLAKFSVNSGIDIMGGYASVNLSGDIDTDGTRGTVTGTSNSPAYIPANLAWCASFVAPNTPYFYPSAAQNATISGEWVIVTNGTQQSGLYSLPTMYAATFAVGNSNSTPILSYTHLRVNFVSCAITTNTNINFGTVARDITPYAELSTQPTNFNVTCEQDDPNTIDTNINVQFSGNVFEGNTSRLALNEGGGYITGEINGVTGSGTCDASTGVNFNYADINVGVLGANELNQSYNNQIIWRLCSGGNTLPTGPVTASANVAVTYN